MKMTVQFGFCDIYMSNGTLSDYLDIHIVIDLRLVMNIF